MTADTRDRPRQLGPYRVLSELGQGGMGVVYLATHVDSGRRVAIKTLLTNDPRRKDRLVREISVVRSLRHPGVVSVVESGERDGTPWYAMELLAGRTLTKHIESMFGEPGLGTEGTADTQTGGPDPTWGTGAPWLARADDPTPRQSADRLGDSDLPTQRNPPPETRSRRNRNVSSSTVTPRAGGSEKLLGFIGQLCHTLSYLHGHGLVHADIKPDNIFVTSGGRVVLMDFGLAAETEGRIDSLELERIGQRAGTAWYTSPEQIRGHWLDARADLYALGCILMEILTGKPPFTLGSPAAILDAHLEARPPVHKIESAHPALREIVERLLAKRPEARPARAGDVRVALEAAGINIAQVPGAQDPDAYLLRPPLIGRARTMDALAKAVDEAVAGHGGVHLLVGPSGVGKTRLALELSRQARAKGFVTLGGRCATISDSHAPSTPLHAFRALGHRLGSLRHRRRRLYQQALGAHGAELLGPYFPQLATGGTGSGHHPSVRGGADGVSLVVEAVVHAITVWTEGAPLLLVMDDVQWADEVSAAVLARMVAHAPSRRWVVLALAKEVPSPVLDSLRQGAVAEHSLQNLDETGTEAMLRGLLGSDVLPPGLVTGILHHSKGNPFQIGEAIRTLIDAGVLVSEDGGWALVSSAETTFNGMASNRVSRLPPDAQQVCAAAATLGSQFDEAVLEEVADLPTSRFRAGLGVLLRNNVLGVDDEGVTFLHDRLRAATADGIRDPSEFHRRAAEALAARNGPLPRQAHHLERAGQLDLARELYWRAAVRAHVRHAPRDAERLFRHAMAVDECNDGVTAQIQCDFAERTLLPQGGLEEAEAVLLNARALAKAHAERAIEGRILMLLGEAYEKMGRRQRARRCVQEALRAAKDLSDTRAEARALNALGESFRSSGDIDTARRLFQVARAGFEQIDDRPGMASVANNLAIVHRRQGDYEEARELYREALRHYEANGDLAGVGRIKSNLAVIHVVTGEHDEAKDLLFEALELRRGAGDLAGEAATLDNLAELHRQRGALEQAGRLQREALALHEQLGDRGAVAWSRKKLADLAYWNDELEAAEAGYVEAITALEGGDSHARLMALVGLGAVQRDQGKVFDASRHFADALSGARADGDLRAQAHALLHRGRMGRYLTEMEHASADLQGALQSYEQVNDRRGVALALCEIGHTALAQERSAAEFHRRAAQIVRALKLAVASEAGGRVLELERAIVARESGEKLILGHRSRDLPRAILTDFNTALDDPKTLSIDAD